MEDERFRRALDYADDRIVAGRAMDGDVEAFAVLVRRYTPMMRAYTQRMLNGSADVDDVVHHGDVGVDALGHDRVPVAPDGVEPRAHRRRDERRELRPQRITATGHGAWWRTCWLTEPIMRPAKPPRPRLPTTTSCGPANSCAPNCNSASAGLPRRIT